MIYQKQNRKEKHKLKEVTFFKSFVTAIKMVVNMAAESFFAALLMLIALEGMPALVDQIIELKMAQENVAIAIAVVWVLILYKFIYRVMDVSLIDIKTLDNEQIKYETAKVD